jgi:hypothetical protein
MRGMVKGIAAALVLVGLLGLGVSTAQAYVWARDCTVASAGIGETGNVEVFLIPVGETQAKMRVAQEGDENVVLAIALTAMSTGKLVNVKTEWAAAGAPIVWIRLLSTAP